MSIDQIRRIGALLAAPARYLTTERSVYMDTSTEPANPFLKHLCRNETILWMDRPNQDVVSRGQSTSILACLGLPLSIIIAGTMIFWRELLIDIFGEIALFGLLAGIGFMYKHAKKDTAFRDASLYAITNKRVLTSMTDHEGGEDLVSLNLRDLDFSRLVVKNESLQGIGTITYKSIRGQQGFNFYCIDDVEKIDALIRIAYAECRQSPEVQQSAPKSFSPL